MKGRQIIYFPDEIAWLERNRTLPIADYHRGFCAGFNRSDVSAANLHALRKRKGWRTGRTGCYAKGQVPMNKGKTMPFHPNSAATRFKAGNLPHNTRYLGHERLTKDGYVQISVAERDPHTGYERRYVLKHRHVWEQANGPLPKGHCLKCLGDDKTDMSPSNWEVVPRGMLPRLNGKSGRNFDRADPVLKPTIMAIAKLEHRARSTVMNQKNREQVNGVE